VLPRYLFCTAFVQVLPLGIQKPTRQTALQIDNSNPVRIASDLTKANGQTVVSQKRRTRLPALEEVYSGCLDRQTTLVDVFNHRRLELLR
jgi:hypothetical protein